jgi:adenine-specific DNA-methyltransferase
VIDKHPDAQFVGCGLDDTLAFSKHPNVIVGDFLKEEFQELFTTIVGNPPFVKTAGKNLFLQFIDRCVELLQPNGELVFIVPSDVFYMTSGQVLMKKMWGNGTFTHVFKPNDERLFENASVDVVVFRYQLGNFERRMTFNGEPRFAHNHSNIITFHDHPQNDSTKSFQELFDVYVGFVSGADAILKNDLGTIPLIHSKNSSKNYLMIDNWNDATDAQQTYLNMHKQRLLDRKIRKFDEQNWWQFGLLRNKRHIDATRGKPCIYIKTITRHEEIAWVGKVGYFGGSLLCMIPTKEIDLESIVTYLNGAAFRSQWTSSGRFRITHRVLSNTVALRS